MKESLSIRNVQLIYSSLFDDKEVKRMSKVKNQFGKQRNQNAELRTKNHKTHDQSNNALFDGPLVASADQLDAKPKTLDPGPKTDSLLGSNFFL